MSLLDRLLRDMNALSNADTDGIDRGGMLGEQYAETIIDDGQNGCYVRNPMIPHPRKPGIFLETDFLVYRQGNLYCVEVKNFKGRVYYPAHYRTVFLEQGWFIFKRRVPQVVMDGYDYSKMVQLKMGQRGEGPVPREMPNPILKTQRYIEDLKRYLYRVDARLLSLPIYPVLAFSEKADISAIYQFDAGIMYISQLQHFFEKYGRPEFSRSPAPWIQQSLRRLPTWDLVLTSGNKWFNGILTDREFRFQATDGRWHAIPYAQISSIEVQREMAFSSAYDCICVTNVNGAQQSFPCIGGQIHLKRFKGEQQVHNISNVSKLIVGIANKC
jgi:hypothetical protein